MKPPTSLAAIVPRFGHVATLFLLATQLMGQRPAPDLAGTWVINRAASHISLDDVWPLDTIRIVRTGTGAYQLTADLAPAIQVQMRATSGGLHLASTDSLLSPENIVTALAAVSGNGFSWLEGIEADTTLHTVHATFGEMGDSPITTLVSLRKGWGWLSWSRYLTVDRKRMIVVTDFELMPQAVGLCDYETDGVVRADGCERSARLRYYLAPSSPGQSTPTSSAPVTDSDLRSLGLVYHMTVWERIQ